jgi:hypothetical protein
VDSSAPISWPGRGFTARWTGVRWRSAAAACKDDARVADRPDDRLRHPKPFRRRGTRLRAVVDWELGLLEEPSACPAASVGSRAVRLAEAVGDLRRDSAARATVMSR